MLKFTGGFSRFDSRWAWGFAIASASYFLNYMTHLFRTAARAALLSGGLLLSAASASFAQLGVARPVGRQTVDAIIVKVDNQIVLRSDLENIYQQELARAEGKPLPPDIKCQILQSMVLNKLMLARAEVDSVVVSDDQVRGELDRRMAYFVQQIGSEKKLEEYYKKPIKAAQGRSAAPGEGAAHSAENAGRDFGQSNRDAPRGEPVLQPHSQRQLALLFYRSRSRTD